MTSRCEVCPSGGRRVWKTKNKMRPKASRASKTIIWKMFPTTIFHQIGRPTANLAVFFGRQKLNTNFFFLKLFGHRRDIPAKSRDIPPKKFDFPGFEGHTELFWPPPLHVEDPYPIQKISGLKSLGLGSFCMPDFFLSERKAEQVKRGEVNPDHLCALFQSHKKSSLGGNCKQNILR